MDRYLEVRSILAWFFLKRNFCNYSFRIAMFASRVHRGPVKGNSREPFAMQRRSLRNLTQEESEKRTLLETLKANQSKPTHYLVNLGNCAKCNASRKSNRFTTKSVRPIPQILQFDDLEYLSARNCRLCDKCYKQVMADNTQAVARKKPTCMLACLSVYL